MTRSTAAFALPLALACSAAAPVEPANDAGTEVDAGGPYVLRVTNRGQRALFVQTSDYSGPAVFLLMQGPTTLPLYDRCELCRCGSCGCAVCGAAMPMVEELSPGESWDQPWGGVVWQVKPSGCPVGDQCEQQESPPAGALTLTATFSASASTSLGASFIDPPIESASTTFELPRAVKLIEVEIQ